MKLENGIIHNAVNIVYYASLPWLTLSSIMMSKEVNQYAFWSTATLNFIGIWRIGLLGILYPYDTLSIKCPISTGSRLTADVQVASAHCLRTKHSCDPEWTIMSYLRLS